jgi:arginyl-tRNA synthetase
MNDKIEAAIKAVCQELFNEDVEPVLTRPNPQFGDFSTNVSFQLVKKLSKSPVDIANQIANKLVSDLIEKTSVAGAGFINIYLNNQAIWKSIKDSTAVFKNYAGQEILIEFGSPNLFKEMHVGNLYTSLIGDALARILENAGSTVRRLSYPSDIGLPVAKAVWAIGEKINWNIEEVDNFYTSNSKEPLGSYYVEGNKAYEEDEVSADKIREVNGHIYKRDDETINKIYDSGKALSLKRSSEIFSEIDIHHDNQYFEGESAPVGLKFVEENIGSVFEKSDGAIVYKGEKVGLHTRVFINSKGLPTYEAKELGLIELKKKDYPNANLSIVLTGNEQLQYFKVVLAALAEFDPKSAKITKHITNGFLSLSTGKMSSRRGDIYTAEKLIADVKNKINEQYPESKIKHEVFLSALKYTFLKQKIGTNIIFDVNDSVSLEGNSGPYIQYAHARAQSILEKTPGPVETSEAINLEKAERTLAIKISEYPEVIERASLEFAPHHICSYLYELAQEFNRFYENNRVIGDPRANVRLLLVKAYAEVLASGLNVLNIPATKRM